MPESKPFDVHAPVSRPCRGAPARGISRPDFERVGVPGVRLARLRAICSSPAIKENLPIAGLAAAYILAVYAVHGLLDIRGRIVLLGNLDWFLRLVLTFAAVFIGLHLRRKSYLVYFTPRYLGGFAVALVLMPVFKSVFASYKQSIPLVHDFSCDLALTRLDRALHFGHLPWELLKPILAYPGVIHFIDYLYLAWFPVLFSFCLWMGWTRRRRLRFQFLLSTLLVWGLLGSVLGTALSSAGPCYYSEAANPAENPYAPLMNRLAEVHRTVYLWAVHNQTVLWEAYREDYWMQFGGISAMPSIHVAMAALFALAAFEIRRWLGVVSAVYLCATQVGSVILGWHYAVDGYAGMALAWVIWRAAGRIVPRGI